MNSSNGHNGHRYGRKIYKHPKAAAHRRGGKEVTHMKGSYVFPGDLRDVYSVSRNEKFVKSRNRRVEEEFGGPGF